MMAMMKPNTGALIMPMVTSSLRSCRSMEFRSAAIAAACVARKVPLVVATTGLEASDQAAIEAAAKEIAILQSPSMSLAVNVAMDLVARAAARHGAGVLGGRHFQAVQDGMAPPDGSNGNGGDDDASTTDDGEGSSSGSDEGGAEEAEGARDIALQFSEDGDHGGVFRCVVGDPPCAR